MPTSVQMEGDGTYVITVQIGSETQDITYRFMAWDVLGHSSETDEVHITVIDTFSPE
ncbi:MAG: hypothetical protein GWN18_09940, partial [Thermoplasmata archaeon]|nr:hypothetical protein [Thermoplasmata archaeon]NIS12363.1 hypothetical protein [Thermoplasmata archaeon]NIV79045.1 hypothetical protein [Thermoplasmata archaeon]NIW82869.1 hypothetical protein [Thermoplasmata archaeon]NIW89088.1 hypothetical protein [Thermoplasmata archaeon]